LQACTAVCAKFGMCIIGTLNLEPCRRSWSKPKAPGWSDGDLKWSFSANCHQW